MEIHSVGPWIFGKTLGSGATGKVKEAYHKATGQRVAIKIITKEVLRARPGVWQKVQREIAILKLLDHPNVLKLIDVFLILEYAEGGELFHYLVSRGRLDADEALDCFSQLVDGLDYCHSHYVIHRDLKPENILLDGSKKRIKLADFGMARLMKGGQLLETSCGSPHYASPEVVKGIKYDGRAADVWSCGIILYALLTGRLPFDDDNIASLLAKVQRGVYSMPDYVPAEAKDLISKMLNVDPKRRATIPEIRAHPWMTKKRSSPLITSYPSSSSTLMSQRVEPVDDPAQLDNELVEALCSLGLGDHDEITYALVSHRSSGRSPSGLGSGQHQVIEADEDEPNLPLVFYRLLEEKKRKRMGTQPPGAGNGSAGSIGFHSSLPIPINGKAASAGGLPSPSPSSLLTVPASPSAPMTIVGGSKARGSVPLSSSPIAGSAPKPAGWLSKLVGLSSSSSKSGIASLFQGGSTGNVSAATNSSPSAPPGADAPPSVEVVRQGGVSLQTRLPLSSIIRELERVLTALDIDYSFPRGTTTDGLPSKLTATYDGADVPSPLQFKIQIIPTVSAAEADGTLHLINFKRKAGDTLTFRTIVSKITLELRL